MEIGRNSSHSPTLRPSKKPKISCELLSSGHEGIFNLPKEIIVEILARLPVKSLLKFRCVSNSWRSLISSPAFVKIHLKVATENAALSRYRMLFTISNPGFDLKHCSVRSLMCEPSTDAINIDYPKKRPYRAVWVVGSCNGLVCIAINEMDLFLWNPSTRLSTKLPPVEVELKSGFYNIFAFGYNESKDDYQVLGIFCVLGNAGLYESIVRLYSLKTNSWKMVENFKGGFPLDDSGKFAGGKLHFSVTPRLGLDFQWDIVSFDLDTEAYGIVEQPNYGEGQFEYSLGVLGGCICVLCDCHKICADVWVLKEYGVKESWAKVVTIPYINDPGKFLFSKSLFVLPSGEILLVFGVHLVIYNPKDNSLRHPQICNLNSFLEADVYVESLVSPAVNSN